MVYKWTKISVLLISILLPCVSFTVLAQRNEIQFDRISIEEGLSQSTVFSVFQDQYLNE